jgi:phage antirepressor YoqD-like protein/biotin operon repressor
MNELTNEKTMTTKELADYLRTSPKVVIENARKCLPNKIIENGKVTLWTQKEVTILIEQMKTSNPNENTFTEAVKAVSTELTPALKMKELTAEKTMTVQELADSLHVSDRTVQNTIKKLANVLSQVKTNSQGGYLLTESQCTRIKMELENHHNIADSTAVKTVSNDMEFFAKSLELQKYATARLAELEKQNQEQKQQLTEQQPKVEFYNIVADSTDAIDMRAVAVLLHKNFPRTGRNMIFKVLRSNHILDSYNLPYQEYMNRGYFRVVETSSTDIYGKARVHKTTLVYQKGVDFIRKIIKENEAK